jgi:hypothetical protein
VQALKATLAYEIDKADITEAETLVFEGVLKQTGKRGMEPGEFYFRPTLVPVFRGPAFWARLFGAELSNGFVTALTIVMACPFCSTPITTSPSQRVLHRSALTIID